jgi:hypothetical protein
MKPILIYVALLQSPEGEISTMKAIVFVNRYVSQYFYMQDQQFQATASIFVPTEPSNASDFRTHTLTPPVIGFPMPSRFHSPNSSFPPPCFPVIGFQQLMVKAPGKKT